MKTDLEAALASVDTYRKMAWQAVNDKLEVEKKNTSLKWTIGALSIMLVLVFCALCFSMGANYPWI